MKLNEVAVKRGPRPPETHLRFAKRTYRGADRITHDGKPLQYLSPGFTPHKELIDNHLAIIRVARESFGYDKPTHHGLQSHHIPTFYMTFPAPEGLKRRGKQFQEFQRNVKSELGKDFKRIAYLNDKATITVLFYARQKDSHEIT
jgi:hypothetical protein